MILINLLDFIEWDVSRLVENIEHAASLRHEGYSVHYGGDFKAQLEQDECPKNQTRDSLRHHLEFEIYFFVT
jgi:hypothetical protein